MFRRSFQPDDLVVFEVEKYGPHPGPRARDVRPEPLGEHYHYLVDKYWKVLRATPDGELLLRTPGGKLRHARTDDPRLRHAGVRDWVWLLLFERERLRALRRRPA
jgi:hypothetical protein